MGQSSMRYLIVLCSKYHMSIRITMLKTGFASAAAQLYTQTQNSRDRRSQLNGWPRRLASILLLSHSIFAGKDCNLVCRPIFAHIKHSTTNWIMPLGPSSMTKLTPRLWLQISILNWDLFVHNVWVHRIIDLTCVPSTIRAS